MRAGLCVGAVPANGCQYSGWCPNWLPPRSEWDQVISGLLNDPDETVCPHCLIDRAVTARISGFNNQKRTRLRNLLNGFWCFRAGGSHSAGHTHIIALSAENVTMFRDGAPADGERDSG